MKGLLLVAILGVGLGSEPPPQPKPDYAEDWRVGTKEASGSNDLDGDVGRSAEREEEFIPVIDPDN